MSVIEIEPKHRQRWAKLKEHIYKAFRIESPTLKISHLPYAAKLEILNTILKNAAIDYTNEEMQDIQNAVLQLLTRVKDTINNKGFFKISHLQPCGSMAEETAVWKADPFYKILTGKEDKKYDEFDYLAVFEGSDSIQIRKRSCHLCAEVLGSIIRKEFIGFEGRQKPTDYEVFSDMFEEEVL